MPSLIRTLAAGGLLAALAHNAPAQDPATPPVVAGRAAVQRNDADGAIAAFAAAVKADDRNADLHFQLGTAYSLKARDGNLFAKARAASRMRDEWEQAISLDSTHYDAHESLYQFYKEAPAIMGGNVDKTLREQSAMLRLRPYQAGVYFANQDYRSKRFAESADRSHALAAAYPDSVAPTVLFVNTRLEQRRFDEAWAAIDAARAHHGDVQPLLYLVGRAAAISGMRLSQGQSALESIIAAPATGVSVSGAHFRLGNIRERLGDTAAARHEYETALRLDPKNVQAKQALDHLGA
ncbi:MAG: Tetratricopeptide repeat-containing protein [Gemmatimonadetes bacterium]|nr:Tetratricopeptide repeat-containing protein [Gemmatimonadota bacterium]